MKYTKVEQMKLEAGLYALALNADIPRESRAALAIILAKKADEIEEEIRRESDNGDDPDDGVMCNGDCDHCEEADDCPGDARRPLRGGR